MTKESVKDLIRRRRIDVIVIASLLLLSVASLLIVNLFKKDGAMLRVEIDGKAVAEYPLHTDGEYALNGGSNILTVENGEAYVSYSNCPEHTCERVGKIRRVGESIVCLPNKLSITVIGSSDGEVDLVS